MDEREDITDYVSGLKAGEGLDENAIRTGYQQFKAAKAPSELAAVAAKHGLPLATLQAFVDGILARHIFDGEHLTELLAPLDLGWKRPPRRNGPDGRPRPAAEEARRRAGDLGAEGVRGVGDGQGRTTSSTATPRLRFPEFRNGARVGRKNARRMQDKSRQSIARRRRQYRRRHRYVAVT